MCVRVYIYIYISEQLCVCMCMYVCVPVSSYCPWYHAHYSTIRVKMSRCHGLIRLPDNMTMKYDFMWLKHFKRMPTGNGKW